MHAATLLWRALRRRCPRCGNAPLFRSWFRMVEICPACGLDTNRGESGYTVGSYMFNVVGSEAVFVAIVGGVIVATWPTPPWSLITVGGPFLMIALPPLFYPFCRTLFLGFDLYFNPEPGD